MEEGKLPKEKIIAILRSYGVRYAGMFGSVARNTEKSDSDIDILIETEKPIGVFALARMQRELSEAIGRPVDLVMRNALDARVAPYVEADLTPIYESAHV